MTFFRGTLLGDGKPVDCTGEYHADEAGNVRGHVEISKRLEPGAFRMVTPDATLEIIIPYIEHDPSGGRHKSRIASRADFEGRLIQQSEPAR